VIAVLAFLQFTIILDFMILSPLGAILMPKLSVTPAQFAWVVSVYAFSAGISGILAAGFADRFDRKRMLLFFYTGFLVGTFLCGIATTYQFLLVARMLTGLFGGVVGSIVFAITTDLFAFEMRGRVMGFIQTAFAASQIMGIPAGLYLASHGDWHTPFQVIVAVGAVVGVIIIRYLRPITGHLKIKTQSSAFGHLKNTVTNAKHLQGFATVALLSTGGFMLMPFGSAFSVHNLGISLDQLPAVYMINGLTSMITGPLIGRASDIYGKFKLFLFGCLLTIVMVLVYTNLGTTSIYGVTVVTALMFVGVTSRMIPSQALMSAIPAPADRGSYMSISSAVQQVSGGVAAVLAGIIVSEAPDGRLLHFNVLGYVVVLTTLITAYMMFRIHKLIPERTT
jgi:predicted MFS family arabinose efflux permease